MRYADDAASTTFRDSLGLEATYRGREREKERNEEQELGNSSTRDVHWRRHVTIGSEPFTVECLLGGDPFRGIQTKHRIEKIECWTWHTGTHTDNKTNFSYQYWG